MASGKEIVEAAILALQEAWEIEQAAMARLRTAVEAHGLEYLGLEVGDIIADLDDAREYQVVGVRFEAGLIVPRALLLRRDGTPGHRELPLWKVWRKV